MKQLSHDVCLMQMAYLCDIEGYHSLLSAHGFEAQAHMKKDTALIKRQTTLDSKPLPTWKVKDSPCSRHLHGYNHAAHNAAVPLQTS